MGGRGGRGGREWRTGGEPVRVWRIVGRIDGGMCVRGWKCSCGMMR